MESADFDINDAVVIKRDNLFLVAPRDARLPLDGHHAFGLYYNDCRFLSGWQLTVPGGAPRPLVSSDARGDAAAHELANDLLHVRIERDLSDGWTLDERITIRAVAAEPVSGELVLRLRSGFEPLMWLRGFAEEYRPPHPRVATDASGVSVSAIGGDGIERRRVTTADPAAGPAEGRRVTTADPAAGPAEGDVLTWSLALEPGGAQTIALRHVVAEGEEPKRRPRAARSASEATRTRVTTNSELFDRVLERSFADLRMLRSHLGRYGYYAAGIPWFATVFGRDTLITSIEMLAFDQRIAEQTLRLLAANLGAAVNDDRDEEPGKVLHEIRVGELANLGVLPFARYYGSVDSTPLFLCLLAEHADWAGDLGVFADLRDQVDAALAWIDDWGDRDGDGLLEYQRRSANGLESQGWKDSPGGVPDARGRPLRTPIALIEAQAYVLRAKRSLAALFDRAGEHERATRLRAQVAELRERTGLFWLERERFYAMALDADKEPGRALASNQGHALWAQALEADGAAAARDALMSAEMFSGWGIRTLSASEAAYDPVGYHTGTVWPHDTALTAAGLRAYGYDDDFARIFDGLLEAASRFPDYRLPELFGGFSREEYDVPVPYPVACRPQAWAAASIPYMLRASLGLKPEGLERRLRVVRPVLPSWLTHVELVGLEVAGARIDLTFERTGGTATLADVRIDGDVDVVVDSVG